jgi:hypothetical protein
MPITNSIGNKIILGNFQVLNGSQVGDLYYCETGNILTRLPIGTTGQLFNVASGRPAWTTYNPIVGGDLSGNLLSPAIAARAATFAKIQAISTTTILGRSTAGSGDIEVLTATQARTVLGLGTAALSNTGLASGNIPVLDAGGKIDVSVLPSAAINSIQVVANQAARLALNNVEIGDAAKQGDTGITYWLQALPASTDANWISIGDTAIDAGDIASGTINPARLGSGTANSTTVLYGDSTYRSLGNLATFAWNTVSGTTQAMVANNGYITTNAALTTLTLPTTGAAVGSIMRVAGFSAAGWRIAQNATQQIRYIDQVTTTGTAGVMDTVGSGGTAGLPDIYSSVELLCVTANTTFLVISGAGNVDLR